MIKHKVEVSDKVVADDYGVTFRPGYVYEYYTFTQRELDRLDETEWALEELE